MWEAIGREMDSAFVFISPTTSAVRMLAAVLLAGVIGFEREYRNKPAGLRTHMLVSLAACLFILVSSQLGSMDFGEEGETRIDPLRLVEAVTAGVAFLAAGLIFTAGGEVRNITTGASMWLAGALGLACGSGQIPLAAMATAIIVCVIALLGTVERRWWPGEPDKDS